MADRIPREPKQGSPEWWLLRLDDQLEDERPDVDLYEDQYEGRHKLQFATSSFRDEFGQMFSKSPTGGGFADNFSELIVDVPVERLAIEGFRGSDARFGERTWAIWQANNLDAASVQAHTETGKHGRAYLLAAPPAEAGGRPQITVEHPSQVTVAADPNARRLRMAPAIKKWQDYVTGAVEATVYLPDGIWKFRATGGDAPTGLRRLLPGSRPGWEYRNGRAETSVERNTLGRVPMIPLENKPSLLTGGRSDLKPVVDLNNAIDKIVIDAMVASEFAGFRQRVLTGIEIPKDENGNPQSESEFIASVSRLWLVEASESSDGGEGRVGVHEFSATDLNNYTTFLRTLLLHLAAISRIPAYYFLTDLVNISGEGLAAVDVGLVAKTLRKQRDYSDSWEDAQRFALRLDGEDALARDLGAETIWANPQAQTLAQVVDAAVKLAQSLELPLDMAWELVGMTPKQVERARRLLGDVAQRVPGAPQPA